MERKYKINDTVTFIHEKEEVQGIVFGIPNLSDYYSIRVGSSFHLISEKDIKNGSEKI